MKNTTNGLRRPRKPFYILIVEQDPRMHRRLNDIPKLLPGVKLEIVKKLTEITVDLALADPQKGDLIPKVIVYGLNGSESDSDINGFCLLLKAVSPKAKRWAPKIILFAASPVLAEATMVMKPDIGELCSPIRGFMPRSVTKRKETGT